MQDLALVHGGPRRSHAPLRPRRLPLALVLFLLPSVAAAQSNPPTAPNKPTATPGNASVTLTWSIQNAAGQGVERWQYSQNGGTWTSIPGAGVNTTSHTVTGLTNGTKYRFKVRASNSVGMGAASPNSEYVRPATTPPAPSKPTVTAGDRTVDLSWSSNGNGGSAFVRWEYAWKPSGSNYVDWIEVADESAKATGLANDVVYVFKVRGVNGVGDGADSPESDPVTPSASLGAPKPPSKPAVTAGDESVSLSWSRNPSGGVPTHWLYRYRWQQADESWALGSWTQISGSGASTTSHTVTGLTNGTAYRFQIRAGNDAGYGESAESDIVRPAVPATAPPAPGQPTATAGDESVTLSWSSGGNGGSAIVRWEYRQNEDGGSYGSWTQISGSGASTTSHTVTGLTNGTAYRFKVRAVNVVGDGVESPASAAATPVAPATAPPAPGQPTATAGDESVTLSWSSGGNGGSAIVRWEYRQSEDGGSYGSWTQISGSGASTTSHTVTGLTNGTAYRFKVRAVNVVGDGAESPASAAAIPKSSTDPPTDPPAKPDKPARPTLAAADGQLGVSWAAPDDNGESITGYDIEYRAYGGSGWADQWAQTDSARSTSRYTVIDSLTNGTRYQVRIRAVNAKTEGPWSDAAEGKPSGAPDTPAAPTVTTGSQPGTLVVTWTAPFDGGSPITGYNLSYKKCEGNCAAITDTRLPATPTSRTATLAPGTKYFVSVHATNANGSSSPSQGTWGTTASGSGNQDPPDDGNDGGGNEGGGNEGGGNEGGGSPGGGTPTGGGTPPGGDDGDDEGGNGGGGNGGGGAGNVPEPRWIGNMAVEAVGRETLYVFWRGEWAEKTLVTVTIEARSREHGWREVGTALATDGQARIGGVQGDRPYTFRLRERMADGSFRYSDYAHGTTGSYRGPCRTTGNAGAGAVERFLCLRDGRFEVRVQWANPDRPGHYGNGGAVPVAMSDESGLFWFFDPANIELAVKVLDGRALNDSFWVFYGALSDVEYWVTVRDTSDGLKRTYYNPPKEMCGRGDVNAFEENGDVTEAAGAASAGAAPWFLGVDLARRSAAPLPAEAGVPVEAPANPAEASPGVAGIDLLALESAPLPAGIESSQSAGACAPSASRLCLLDGRFSVDVDFVDPNVDDPASATKEGRVLPSLTTGQTGFFWFFDPRNIELAVKTLDGRARNGRFWLLYGGLSDVEYTLTVTDTATGAVKSYRNESGSLCGQADTNAF